MTLRKIIVRSNILFGLLIIASFIYMRFIESTWLEVNTYQVNYRPEAKNPITILHMSDLHYSKFVDLKYIERAFKEGLTQKPDLIVLTGDYHTQRLPENYTDVNYIKVLKLLSTYAPTYACLGNHDGGVWANYDSKITQKIFEESGIKVLRNEKVSLNINNKKITLIGLGDLWAEEFDAKKAFNNVASNDPSFKIVLVHNPDTKELLSNYPWDLMLAGHSHGGQLQLPIIGAPFAPVDDKNYISGLKRWKNHLIHVTKGVGNLWGMRFNCRPEVSIIKLY